MRAEDRRDALSDLINTEGSVSFKTIKKKFDFASEATLRNDLKTLDEENRIIRVFGGAKSVKLVVGTDDYIIHRSKRHVESKKIIAEKAISLLRTNDTIYIDSGTTLLEFAKMIPDDRYFILTSGINSAIEMSRLTETSIFIIGGQLNRYSLSTYGPRSIDELNNVNFNVAFLGTTAYNTDYGFTTASENESFIKRTVIERSNKVVMLMDSSKVDKTMTYTFAKPKDIDVLISDDALLEEDRLEFESNKVRVL